MTILSRAENDARALRERTIGPVRFLPIDPVVIAKRLGLEVFLATLPDNVSGALIKKAGESPGIYLHRGDSLYRQRFTCAHELGHFVSRMNNGGDMSAYDFIDMRGELAAAGTDPEEIYANAFAAELLMPEDVLRRMHSQGMTPTEMLAMLKVSDVVLSIRLKALRFF